MTTNITYIIYLLCVFLWIHYNMMIWKINYEAIHIVTVLEVYDNDWYEIHDHIITLEDSTNIITWAFSNIFLWNGIAFSCILWQPFCLLVHESLTIDMQSFPLFNLLSFVVFSRRGSSELVGDRPRKQLVSSRFHCCRLITWISIFGFVPVGWFVSQF